MTKRERLLRAITFGSPDVIPINHSSLQIALIEHGQKLIDVLRKYPDDFPVNPNPAPPKRKTEYYRPDGSYYQEITDEWGCTWVYYQEGILGEVKRFPLADWANLKSYRLPAPLGVTEQDKAAVRKDGLGVEYLMRAGSPFSLFERMQWLHGTEDLLCDIAEDRPEVYALADRIMSEYLLPSITNLFRSGLPIDMICFGDDWGSQNSLLINPETWRKIFKPRYKILFDACRKGGALVLLHSDGATLEIVPDLIEIGVNCFNPQFSCLDLLELKQRCGESLSIWSDIDRQHLIPRGTPAEIEAYVRNVYEIFGSPKGGLIWRGWIESGVPIENIEALLAAFYKYRTFEVTHEPSNRP